MRRPRPLQRLALVLAAAVLLAVSGGTLGAAPALAGGDQLQASGVATYTLVPDRQVIHVTTVYTLVNRAPVRRPTFDCSYWTVTWSGATFVPKSCRRQTGKRFTSYRFWIEKDAQRVQVRASSGSARARAGGVSAGYRRWTATFSPLGYGRTRRLTVSYDLPAAGPRPPSATARRASFGFASFCASGPTSDTGTTRIVVPDGYQLTVTPPLAATPSGASSVYSSGRLAARPWEFEACLSGPNADGFTETPVAGLDGSTVTVEAWKDDTEWLGRVTEAIGDDLPGLAAALGPPVGTLPTTVREAVADDALPLPTGGGTWSVAEWIADSAAVSRPLAELAWLPEPTFGDGWVRAGTLDWARSAAGLSGSSCDEPLQAPVATADELGLSNWSVPATDAPGAVEVRAYKRQAACFVVSEVAAAAGDDRMRTAIAAIRDGWDAWSPADAPVKRATQAIGWRDWLDIVTERALIPAGADPNIGAELLATYDPSIDPAVLAPHAAARDAYHRHLAAFGTMPASITDAMRRWDDTAAQAGLDAASEAASTAASVPDVLPGVVVDGGPVEVAIRAAQTQADLDAAKALATSQVALAHEVADAFALEAAPRDAIAGLGLAGTRWPDHAAAIAAVTAVDASAAHGQAAQVQSLVDGAGQAGLVRLVLIGAALGGIVVLAVVALLLVRRRRGRAVRGASMEADGAGAPATSGAPAGESPGEPAMAIGPRGVAAGAVADTAVAAASRRVAVASQRVAEETALETDPERAAGADEEPATPEPPVAAPAILPEPPVAGADEPATPEPPVAAPAILPEPAVPTAAAEAGPTAPDGRVEISPRADARPAARYRASRFMEPPTSYGAVWPGDAASVPRRPMPTDATPGAATNDPVETPDSPA